jgi:hypothetical protein
MDLAPLRCFQMPQNIAQTYEKREYVNFHSFAMDLLQELVSLNIVRGKYLAVLLFK